MFLSDLSIRRPVVASVMMLTLVTLGLFSFRRLPIDMMPDVEIPVLSIVTQFPGASPETVEREVSKKIEEAVNPISGVKHVVSVSREGLSSVIVEFNLDVRINDASQEARAKINAVRGDLPEGMKEPVIQKFDFNAMPIVSLAIRSKSLSPRELTTMADRKVKRRLESIAGVARAKLVGDSRREVAVNIDPVRLAAIGMGVDEVVNGLATENVNTPLGRLTQDGTEMPLRISGKPRTPDEYGAMVIGRRGIQPIRLGDVATIVDTIEEPRTLALINGEPAVALDITKQSKANTVGVVDAVLAAVARLREEMPPGVEIQVVRDTSVFIREAVSDVMNTLLLGGLLTVIIVFCFLNSWRSTVITGLTLPISVVSSFIVMYFLGMTLNTLTLMALSLAIGMLIDDAIVVRENIVRHLEHGEDHFTAARKGTSEIGLAVLATSMSIISVFVPVAFMKGVIGRFFFQFGLTVAFAVLVSLFVSFTLDPMLSSRWYDPDIERRGRRNPLQRGLDRFNAGFERMANAYKRVIGWALDHRLVVCGVAVAAFVGGISIFGLLQSEFMTPMDQGEFMVKFKSAPGSSMAETRGRLEEVLATVRAMPAVRYTYATIGAGDADTVRDGTVFVKLVERKARTASVTVITHDTRAALERIPGLILSVQDNPDAMQKPLQVAIQGDEIAALKQYASELQRHLSVIPGIVDIEAAMQQDLPEYRLVVNRERSASSGLGSAAVARTVAVLVGGQAVSTYEDEEGEAVDLRIRLPGTLRQNIAQVENLKLSVTTGRELTLVPLVDLVTFARATSPAEISRRDLARQVTVDANLDNLPLGTAGQLATAAAQELRLAPGYKLVMGGDTEIMVESFGYLAEALLLAVIFVYLILAAQFESFVDPLAIMLSLPLSIVGMAGMLLLTGSTINIMSLIGLIMLMGLVTKNAILLVDYTKVLRASGLDRRTALITAGRTRLRPIVMTTAAMIVGMLPLFLALGEGAEFRAPMARAVVGGLLTSTLLTLIVVPVVYTLLDDVAGWFRKPRKPSAAQVAAVSLAMAAIMSSPTLAQEPETAAAATKPALSRMAAGRQGPNSRLFQAPAQDPASAARPAPPAGPHAGSSRQPPASSPVSVRVLSLDEALNLAGAQNLDIQKARTYQQWVQGKYLEERAAALPQATAIASVFRNFDNSQSKLFRDFMPDDPGSDTPDIGEIFGGRQEVRSGVLQFSQVLFTWGQVGAAIRAAKLGFGYADEQLRQFRQAVARDVTIAFCAVLATRELARIAEADLAQKERHLEESTRRQAAGTVTDYDVLAAQVTVDNARPAVIRSHNRVRLAREQLRFLLAEPGPVDVTGELAMAAAPAPSFEEALAQALANRPEIGELRAQTGIYGELVKIAGAGNKPRLDFSGSWGQRSLGLKTLSSDGTLWTAGIFATIPLFDGMRTKGRVAQARTDLTRVSLDEQKLRDAISVEVQTALNDLQEATEITTALSSTVSQAERLLFLAEKGYELGVKTRLDVQDAEVNVLSARANLALAQRDYRVAQVTLQWVTGTLDGGRP